MKLGLLLLEPKLGLLGPVLELLTPLPHLLRLGIAPAGHVSDHVSELLGPLPHRLLGLAIGLEGLDLIHGFVIHRFVRLLIDRFVELSIESLESPLPRWERFLRRQLLRRWLPLGLQPVPSARDVLVLGAPVRIPESRSDRRPKTPHRWGRFLGRWESLQLMLLGLRLRAFVVLLWLIERCRFSVFSRPHGSFR